ncbi:MAG: S8 family serine peptidase [Candidatus Latescibacterota bacterium]
MKLASIFLFFIFISAVGFCEPGISPSLFFSRQNIPLHSARKAASATSDMANVTIRFSHTLTTAELLSLEAHGVKFTRENGRIVHIASIYPASIPLDSLESIAAFPGIIRIEDAYRPVVLPTLDVSNPEVQASKVWGSPTFNPAVDGSGVKVVNIDTGIDIYHPAFFKTDGGTYAWIDVNGNSIFDSGIDVVDLNANEKADSGETLSFYDAPFSDQHGFIKNTATAGMYDADLDWLYNDFNANGKRDFGPASGYGENSPGFGERIFLISDTNHSNRLEPGESLIGLGTSKIIAIYDKNGTHLRGQNLMTNVGDTFNHGTGSSGIVGGQHRGRRLTGMAPGVEFICINRINMSENNVISAIFQACSQGANIFMYEYGSWVFEFLDGSSNIEVLIDSLYTQGYHQFTASGNLAGPARKKHAAFTLKAQSPDTLYFTIPDSGIKQVYLSIIWRTSNNPSLSLKLPNNYTVPIDVVPQERDYPPFKIQSGLDTSPVGTKRMDIVILSGSKFSGTMSIVLNNRSRAEMGIHAYIADDVTQWMYGAQFTNYVTDDGTICSPGTAIKGITVGAYDPRGTRNSKGAINDFSSWGKTMDGRRGVEITAPGTLVYSFNSISSSNPVPGGYFEFGGTSAALPHAVGCAALLIQANPAITPDELSRALIENALKDEFTGPVPNDIWGYGKLRIYDTFFGLKLLPSVAVREKPELFTISQPFPNPFNSSASFSVSVPDPSRELHISIYNILGQTVVSKRLSGLSNSHYTWTGVNDKGEHVSSGLYFALFRYDDLQVIRRLTYLR